MIKLDGTPNKGKLGANAILAVSMAATEAGAADKVSSPAQTFRMETADSVGSPPLRLPRPACWCPRALRPPLPRFQRHQRR